jgi:glycosyltransferase involved in cell wall biosynthesis
MGRYIRDRRIRIVHTFDVPLTLFGVPAAKMFRAPLVLSSQRAHRGLVSPFTRHLLRLTDSMADGIVVNSKSVRRQLIEEDRVPPSRLHLCYNAINTQRFHPCPRSRVAPPVVGVVCALRPEKDLPTLLEAFARVQRLHAQAKLLLVGGGPMLPQLEALRDSLGLNAACQIEPASADVTGWLHSIDIFVLPSKSEALSNSLMEAMACGCCAVASRTGGNPELVKDGRTGLLFEPGDAAGLAARLQTLIEGRELRQSLAAAGTAFIRSFTVQASARRMEEIYSTLTYDRT